jgi:nuclear pore complex protein Nup155
VLAQERTAQRTEAVGDEDIARALLVACKGAAEPAQRTYDRLLASGAILPSPPLRLRMLRSVLHVMREWTISVLAQQMGTNTGGSVLLMGGTLSSGQTGAMNNGIKDKLCTAANR